MTLPNTLPAHNGRTGSFLHVAPVTFSADVNASGNTGAQEFAGVRNVRAKLTATISAGIDPTLDVIVEGAATKGGTYYTIETFAQLTESGTESKSFFPDNWLRLGYTVASSPGDVEQTAGSPGSVTQTTGTGPGFTVSGTPIVEGLIEVTISTGGAPGTAEFDWTIDGAGGAAGVAIPTTPFQVVLTGTGLTLTFENDTFVENDVFEFEAQVLDSPGFTAAGTPTVDGDVVVTISAGGAPGTAEFDWTIDGAGGAVGVAIPTTPFQVLLTGTGVTLTFENDTFVEGDVFELALTKPVVSLALTGESVQNTKAGKRRMSKGE
jgi:hypothetical protein